PRSRRVPAGRRHERPGEANAQRRMIERQRALRSSEIENGRYPALHLRAGDGGRHSRDAQVHISIDESGNQGKPAHGDRVRSARRLAAESQHDLAAAEAAEKAAAEKQERARSGGVPPLQAADLLAQGKSEANEARTRAVKARARLNFALDRMDEAERREWEALQAEARAETHAQLAEDPLFKKT